MPNTTTYEFGEVVLVPFPFADLQTAKKRTAVVISANAYNAEAIVLGTNDQLDLIVVMGITSVQGALGAVEIKRWQQAGLRRPSAFKPVITTLAPARVIQRLGKLSIGDSNQLKRMIMEVLNLTPASSAPAQRS